ncbi:MAG: AAA family ATPase [Clostridia bacterium]|nr:AAA family ATPase [Clostridia bacterium]
MTDTEQTREADSLELALKRVIHAFGHTVVRFWMVIPLVALLFGTLGGLKTYIGYSPRYTTQATYTVEVEGAAAAYYSNTTAKQLANSFPYILSSGELMNLVAKDLGLPAVPASIRASVLGGTNMLTIYVSASEPELAFDVLQSVVKLYPKIAEYVVGKTSLNMVISPTLPDTPDNAFAWFRTSVKWGFFGIAAVLFVFLILSLFRITVISDDDLKDRFGHQHVVTVPLIMLGSRRKKQKKTLFMRKKRTEKKSEAEIRAAVPPSERLISINDSSVNKAFSDAFGKLRNTVTHSDGKSGTKSIVVTSTLPGEGKTTAAINLSLALSKHGYKVLLIDCDLRKPSVLYSLGIECHTPFSEVIRGHAKLSDANIRFSDSLTILGDSKYNADAAELVSSEFMHKLIRKGSEIYDYIVIDSPPCNDISDSVALAEWADGLIYVVRQDYALFSNITAALGRHRNGHARLISFVLNGVKKTAPAEGTSYSGSAQV